MEVCTVKKTKTILPFCDTKRSLENNKILRVPNKITKLGSCEPHYDAFEDETAVETKTKVSFSNKRQHSKQDDTLNVPNKKLKFITPIAIKSFETDKTTTLSKAEQERRNEICEFDFMKYLSDFVKKTSRKLKLEEPLNCESKNKDPLDIDAPHKILNNFINFNSAQVKIEENFKKYELNYYKSQKF